VRADKRFDGLYDHRSGDISKVFERREDAFLEYWNAWDLEDPKTQFEESQKTAVAVLMGTDPPGPSKFDFFFVHLLTSSHAVRVILPLVRPEFQKSLVRQWWLFTLAVYITQLRPEVNVGVIENYELKGRNWKFVKDKALNSSYSLDAHYVKGKPCRKCRTPREADDWTALRAMLVISETWGDSSEFYLKSAVKFADEFEHWGGFGTAADDDAVSKYEYPRYQ
jgi:hypothetical protein